MGNGDSGMGSRDRGRDRDWDRGRDRGRDWDRDRDRDRDWERIAETGDWGLGNGDRKPGADSGKPSADSR